MTQQFQVKATSFLYLKYASNLRKGIPAQPLCMLWLQKKIIIIKKNKTFVIDAIIAP